MTFRSQKLRDAARGEMCVMCGVQDETVVMAHLAWPGIADRGTSHKSDDFWSAHLCARCHREADEGPRRRDLEWRTQAVARTLRRLFNNGVIRA